MNKGIVYFAHGKESGPQGRKIVFLGDICRELGWRVESPDYSRFSDAEARVRRLLEVYKPVPGHTVLVGSSMGAYVSARAAEMVKPRGLFLMAPAVFLPGYPATSFPSLPTDTLIVHGWRDAVVPVENAMQLASESRSEINVIDADHGLGDALPRLGEIFRSFLRRMTRTR